MKGDMCKICMNSVAQFRTWPAQKQLNLKFTSSAEPSLRARMSFFDCQEKNYAVIPMVIYFFHFLFEACIKVESVIREAIV